MAVKAVCPACRAVLPVTDEDAGKEVRCEKCEQVFTAGDKPKAGKRDDGKEDGTNASPWMQDAEVAKAKGQGEQAGGTARRSGKAESDKTDRDDDLDEKAPPRSRTTRPRDKDDDPPARRTGSMSKKSGGRLGLILGLAAGAAVFLLAFGAVGFYFLFLADNRAVTEANFQKVGPDTPLQEVEVLFGRGSACDAGDARDLMRSGNFPENRAAAVSSWYRWKNGHTTLLIGVDGSQRVRVAGLVTRGKNFSSVEWKSGGGAAPLPGPGRRR